MSSHLTWRESLRDIEACLAANQTKLFHMGMKAAPARSTLADALERRDWRIYHALAQRLIARARAKCQPLRRRGAPGRASGWFLSLVPPTPPYFAASPNPHSYTPHLARRDTCEVRRETPGARRKVCLATAAACLARRASRLGTGGVYLASEALTSAPRSPGDRPKLSASRRRRLAWRGESSTSRPEPPGEPLDGP
jgi:hypothetical protein